jgi:hypothetical protein
MSNGLLGEVGRYSKGALLRVVSAEITGAADAFWHARTDSGIKSLKDARGKSIAFSSGDRRRPGNPGTGRDLQHNAGCRNRAIR